jgi:hypothetical protein
MSQSRKGHAAWLAAPPESRTTPRELAREALARDVPPAVRALAEHLDDALARIADSDDRISELEAELRGLGARL